MQTWKRAPKFIKFLVVSIGVCWAVVILVVIVAAFAPEPEESSQAAGTGLISTPQPTRLPTSTLPPDDCASPAAQAYINDLGQLATDTSGALGDFNRLNVLAANSPLLVVNEDWQLQVVVALATLNSYANEMDELHPPSVFQPIHPQVVEMASEIRNFTTLYARGVDNIDAETMDLAGERMVVIGDIAFNLTADLQSLCG